MRSFGYICAMMMVFTTKAQVCPELIFQKTKTNSLELHSKFLNTKDKPLAFGPVGSGNKATSCVLKVEPMPLAFFCKMEDRFRNNFHVFLKIRMGDDESYMKLIGRH